MSDLTYSSPQDKPLVWLAGAVKTPPFSPEARRETGLLLRLLQRGRLLSLPHSRPMPSVGARCHELRVRDRSASWRIVYRLEVDAVVILDAFEKTMKRTPQRVINECAARLRRYERATRSGRQEHQR